MVVEVNVEIVEIIENVESSIGENFKVVFVIENVIFVSVLSLVEQILGFVVKANVVSLS